MTVLRHADLRSLNYCNRGIRELAARHKLNWQIFMQQGIDTNEISHIDDEMVRRAIERAEDREAQERMTDE